VSTLVDPVTDVFRVVGRFRRQLRRSAGRGFDSTRVSEAQSELLWLVGRQPGISVSATAAELGLVPDTASTLVSNPLSYEVDALRALLIGTSFNPADIAVLVLAAVLGIATASTLLRRLVS
jgi:hypothetical protein